MTVPTNPPRTGRPVGSIDATPGRRQMNEYRRELRRKADAGDVDALGYLVLSETLREQRQQQQEGR